MVLLSSHDWQDSRWGPGIKPDRDRCQCQQETETLAAELCAAGLPSAPYHAQMDPLARQDVHRRWAAGAQSVPLATLPAHGRNLILVAHRQLHLGSRPITACPVASSQGSYRLSWGLLPSGWASTKWMCASSCTRRWQSEVARRGLQLHPCYGASVRHPDSHKYVTPTRCCHSGHSRTTIRSLVGQVGHPDCQPLQRR